LTWIDPAGRAGRVRPPKKKTGRQNLGPVADSTRAARAGRPRQTITKSVYESAVPAVTVAKRILAAVPVPSLSYQIWPVALL
jgi:hypothetical protein